MTIRRFLPAIGWFMVSLVLLCLPGSSLPRYPWLALVYADKWVHITLFFIVCFLFNRPFRHSGYGTDSRKEWFLLITVSGIFYGTFMEFVQKYWIPNRSFEILDIAADSLGCLLAYFYSLKKFLREVV